MPVRRRSNKSLGALGLPIYQIGVYPTAVLNWDFFGAQVGDAAKGIMRDKHKDYYPKIRLEYIVDIDEAENYDIWHPEIVGERNVYYFRNTSYWLIELIDDPGAKFLDPNKRKPFYGKQKTNRFQDQFWASVEERSKNTLYTTAITKQLNDKGEIKRRTNLYASLRSKNQLQNQQIKNRLDKKVRILSSYENIGYEEFRNTLKSEFRSLAPARADFKYLLWYAKNDPTQFRKAVTEGFTVLTRSSGTQANVDELFTGNGAAQIMIRGGIRTLFGNTIKRVDSGFTKNKNVFRKLTSLEISEWVLALRRFALHIYNQAPPGIAKITKKGSFWKAYIDANYKSRDVRSNLRSWFESSPSIIRSDIADQIQPDKNLKDIIYFVPDWGDGQNHSITTGDGDYDIPVLGEQQLTTSQLGKFEDPAWGAIKYDKLQAASGPSGIDPRLRARLSDKTIDGKAIRRFGY
tara:strand:- start:1304 stop:2686 length:1383 start_codon:yes stop_codon:yes gene_type:complete